MKKFLFFLMMMAVLSFGCKQRVVTQPEAQQPAGEQERQAGAEKEGKTPEQITEGKAPSETVESREGTEGAEGREGQFKDVLFDFDKYMVNDSFKPELKSLATWLTKNTGAKLSVEGHCDERGTNEYNLALGERRAKAVKDYLVSLGVRSSRIETISYGSEKPLCTEKAEECWAKNRRAHFVVLTK